MEEYPEELRRPPVTLISLVGCPDLHKLISTHLHSQQPPINTLALPDFDNISSLFPRSSSSSSPSSSGGDSSSSFTGGILKRDWLLKHRTRVPAVIAALFTSDYISGDPTQWLQFCTDLDNLKAVIRGRNIKLVLIIVQSTVNYDISEERMTSLRKRAEVDSKYLITIDPNDASELEQSLDRLARTFAELANIYYRDEGRKIKTRIERKSFNSIELSIRYCFKVAVYAEFRRDWAEALRFYEEAYHLLREMIGISTRLPTVQRLVEIKEVAEQINFKISTLLLHGGKPIEAVAWFRKHNASYKKIIGAREAMFIHWEWMSRQFLVFAELLETSSAVIQNIPALANGSLTEWEFRPAYYYQLAAKHLKEKRCCLEVSLSMSETVNEFDSSAASVLPSVYVGQFATLLEQGDEFSTQSLTDEEYINYALAEGKRFQDSIEIIALLKKSFESFENLKALRMASFCGSEMASEYFSMGDFLNAKKLFEQVVSLYRQEGWVTLLWEVLGYLRECSKELGSVKDFIEYSLEMAALPITDVSSQFKSCGPAGPASLTQREIIHQEVFGLVKGESDLASNEGSKTLKVTEDQPLHLEIDPVSPLRVVLLASVAFHEQIVKPGASTMITLSLLSELPQTIEIDRLEVQFNQSECNFSISNAHGCPVGVEHPQTYNRVETAPVLTLVTNKWLRLTYDIKSEQSGKLECVSITVRLGPHFTICCRAESPASMDDLPLWKFEDRAETFPTKDPALAFSGQKAIQVEEPESLVDLILGTSGPALVGERFMVPVTVISKGHTIYSGEMKINLVDVRGGGLVSPRELEPFTVDTNQVELLGIVGAESENDPLRKIQQSFGLVSVPQLNNGESWSSMMEIIWHGPKPIMLYVSLGYSPHSNESTAQKVHVHKSLQIEGKLPITISHRFMLSFRRDPLLLSKIRTSPDSSDELTSLPRDETSILIVNAKNCTEVPLQLLSISIEPEDDGIEISCTIQDGGEELITPALLVPGEEYKKVFSVVPSTSVSKIKTGTLCLKWRRNPIFEKNYNSTWVTTRYKLPDAYIESPPLIVTLECPPNAILGIPFTYFVKIRNQTRLLQEISFSLADSQSFLLSGSHNDTVYVLPKSEYILSYKLVPLASGLHQMPKVTATSTRYSAGFLPSVAASTVFVFPSNPCFHTTDIGDGTPELLIAK